MAIHPDVLLREAVGEALDECGLPTDEKGIDEFLEALKLRGYAIVQEVNAVPLGDKPK